jgi:hypothetical protein
MLDRLLMLIYIVFVLFLRGFRNSQIRATQSPKNYRGKKRDK